MERKGKRVWVLAVALLGVVLTGVVATAQKNREAEVALQAAIQKEKVDGELEDAIRQYKEILAKHKSDRAVAAQALVHIGQCYEKLGKGEAQKAYQQVLKEYADQAEALKVARERLSALRALDRKAGGTLAVRKVWAEPLTDTMGEISPDARYLSFVDWDTGDLAVRDLDTGKNRRLTNKGAWKESGDFAEYSRWSPDGRKLAYDWYVDRPGQTPIYVLELRIMTVANSQSRVVYKTRNEKEWLETSDWSPDGKQIAVVRYAENNGNEIVLVSAADGRLRVLKTLGRESTWPVLFSPDGRYLVYSYGGPERDVFLLSADGKQAATLIEHPADDVALGWSPDGRWVLFLSDRTGSLDLWAVRVAGGKAQGEAQLIKPALGRAVPLGVAKDGSLYYGMTQHTHDVYVARLDPRTGKILGPPVKAVKRFEGVNDWPWYSPDGKRLAYVSARRSGARLYYNVLCVRSLETGEEREYPTKFRRLAGTRWAPDGRSVFVAAWVRNDRASLCRIDLQTGEVSQVVVGGPDEVFRGHEVSGDHSLIYVRRDLKSQVSSIIRRDLRTGNERELFHGPPKDEFTTALSPDGHWLAFLNFPLGQTERVAIVRVMPAAGGEPREIWRFAQSGWIPLAWGADGKYLLVPRKISPDDRKQSLWRVPASGGAPEKLGLEAARLHDLSARPDGKQIAFAAWEGQPAEVWVMENLLSELKGREQAR
jgi:Tol biopolymer transport system component